MPTIPEFDTSAEVTGATLISETDEEIRQLMTDVKNYQETISSIVDTYTTEEITSAITNLNADITLKMNELLSVNPDGTYYTKTAIDNKFEEVQTEASKSILANFPFSGYVQKKPKEDGLYFEESTNFIASIGDKGQFLNFNGTLIDATTHVDYVAGKGLVKDLSDFIPETQIISGTNPVTISPIASGDYIIYDRPELDEAGKIESQADVDTYDNFNTTSAFVNSIGGRDAVMEVRTDVATSNYISKSYNMTVGQKYIVSFDRYSPSSNARSNVGYLEFGGVSFGYVNTENTWYKEHKIITATATNMLCRVRGDNGLTTIGDKVYLDNISVKPYIEVYRATEDIPVSTPLTDIRFQTTDQSPTNYINNRKHSQVTNQIIVTQVYNDVTNTYLGFQGEVAFNDVSVKDSIKQIMTSNNFTQEGTCYRKGDNLHILVDIWQTLSKGAYHPFLNSRGVAYTWFVNGGGGENHWYFNSVKTHTSIANTFDIGSPNSAGEVSPFVKPSGYFGYQFISAHPQSKFYNIIYEDDSIDYRLSAEKANLPEILADGNNAMISNQSLGGLGVANEEFIESTLQVTTGTVDTLEVKDGTNYTIGKDVQVWNGSTAYRKRITNISSNTLTLDSTISKTAIEFIISGGTKPILSQGSSLKSEILSNPTRYATILTDRLSEGKECLLIANLFDDNGNSNIPDGIKTTFKLNKKVLEQLKVLKTSDLGATWTVESVTFNSIENTITFSSAPSANDMILVQNTALNTPSFQSDPLPIEWLGNKSIASNQAGSNISYSQGYVSTSDKLENRNLEDNFLDENSSIQGLPIQNTHTLSTSSNGVKMLSSLAKLDGELVYQMFTEEAKSTVSSWDRGNYDELTNGTTDDNNTTKVRTSVQIFRTGEQI